MKEWCALKIPNGCTGVLQLYEVCMASLCHVSIWCYIYGKIWFLSTEWKLSMTHWAGSELVAVCNRVEECTFNENIPVVEYLEEWHIIG